MSFDAKHVLRHSGGPMGKRRRWVVLVSLAGVVSLASCSAPLVGNCAIDQPAAVESELDFWQALEPQSRLTNHDALHGLLLIADGADERAGWEARLAEARVRGWVGDGELAPDGVATVGMVSVAICQLLDLEGGVTMTLLDPWLGRSQRYCTRELIFARLLPERSPQQSLRGLELLDLAGRVEDWRAEHGAAADAGERS